MGARIHGAPRRGDSARAAREIFYSARAWAKLNDLVATRTYLQHLGAIAGRIGHSEGLSPDRIPDGRDGAVNGWPLWVWDRAYAEVSA